MSAYKLFLDKNNKFQCSLQLEGASLDNAHARLIVDARGKKLLYEGTIKSNGECSIDLNKLNELFKSDDVGTMKLEIIAEDAYFQPWESSCEFDVSKKVVVEVMSPQDTPKKPTISVNIVTEETREMKNIVESVVSQLRTKKISSGNIKKHKPTVTRLIQEKLQAATYTHNLNTLITNVVQQL